MNNVWVVLNITDRLIQYYCPSLHKLIGHALSAFIKPRETPLADELVLSAAQKTDPAQFTLLNRMQDKVHNLNHTDMAAECLDHMAAGIDGLYKTSCAGCETRSSRKYLVSSRANDSHSM